MYDNTKIRILNEIYLKGSIHKRALSRNLGLSMPSVENAIKQLKQVLISRKVGNQLHYSLDYLKFELGPALSMVEQHRFLLLPQKIQLAIKEYLKALPDKPIMAILFGSYARGDYRKNSDIDIFLVYQSVKKPEMIENIAAQISLTTGTKLNPVYLDYDNFRKSFADMSNSFFKALRHDRLVIAGHEWWRMLESEIS